MILLLLILFYPVLINGWLRFGISIKLSVFWSSRRSTHTLTHRERKIGCFKSTHNNWHTWYGAAQTHVKFTHARSLAHTHTHTCTSNLNEWMNEWLCFAALSKSELANYFFFSLNFFSVDRWSKFRAQKKPPKKKTKAEKLHCIQQIWKRISRMNFFSGQTKITNNN